MIIIDIIIVYDSLLSTAWIRSRLFYYLLLFIAYNHNKHGNMQNLREVLLINQLNQSI